MHVESLEVDFFSLPTGRFGLAVRRSTSVGWKMGTPVVESSTATFQRNQLTFAAWILVHRFLQQLRLHPLPVCVPLFTRAECRSAV